MKNIYCDYYCTPSKSKNKSFAEIFNEEFSTNLYKELSESQRKIKYLDFSDNEAKLSVSSFTGDIKCKCEQVDTPAKAYLLININEKPVCALCSICLHQFGFNISALLQDCQSEKDLCCPVTVEKIGRKTPCFSCGKIRHFTYRIYLNRIQFELCERCFIDFVYKIVTSDSFSSLFPHLKNDILLYCDTAKSTFKSIDEKEKIKKELVPINSGSVINLGIKQETAKKYPLVSFNTLITNDFSCIMEHNAIKNKNAVIKADRKNDKLCTVLCRACVEELCFALRTVNEKNINYSNNDGLSVTYFKKFNKGDFCYFCGFDDDACYDITLNKIRFQICSHCRERYIIHLKKLISDFDKKESDYKYKYK